MSCKKEKALKLFGIVDGAEGIHELSYLIDLSNPEFYRVECLGPDGQVVLGEFSLHTDAVQARARQPRSIGARVRGPLPLRSSRFVALMCPAVPRPVNRSRAGAAVREAVGV